MTVLHIYTNPPLKLEHDLDGLCLVCIGSTLKTCHDFLRTAEAESVSDHGLQVDTPFLQHLNRQGILRIPSTAI